MLCWAPAKKKNLKRDCSQLLIELLPVYTLPGSWLRGKELWKGRCPTSPIYIGLLHLDAARLNVNGVISTLEVLEGKNVYAEPPDLLGLSIVLWGRFFQIADVFVWKIKKWKQQWVLFMGLWAWPHLLQLPEQSGINLSESSRESSEIFGHTSWFSISSPHLALLPATNSPQSFIGQVFTKHLSPCQVLY